MNRTRLDRSFESVLLLKGLDGILELIGGVFLLVAGGDRVTNWTQSLTQHELSQDPHDFIANHLLHSTQHLHGSGLLFGVLYLLIHGLVKVVLVLAVLKERHWAYLWMIGFLSLFMVYQIYRLSLNLTLGLSLLTIFDGVVIWLTYQEYLWHSQKSG